MSESQEQEYYLKVEDDCVIFDAIIPPLPQAIAIGGNNEGAMVIFQIPYSNRAEAARLINVLSHELKVIVMPQRRVQLFDKRGEPIEQGSYSAELAKLNASADGWFF